MSIKLTFPDGRKTDKALVDFAERMLADAGVSQAQADFIASAWQTHVDQWMQTDTLKREADADQEIAALKTHWGREFDSHIASGRKAAASLGLDAKALDALDRTIGASATMNLLAAMGRRVTTDTNTGETKITITDPTAARAEIERLAGDRAFQNQLRDVKNPTARADALSKWNDLHAAVYPAPEAPPPPPAPAAPSSTPAPGKREAAELRIRQLQSDDNFQDRMRQPGPGREAAVHEWNELHRQAYTPEGGAQ